MSTSLLYHGWALKGYYYCRAHHSQDNFIFMVKPHPRSLACPVCSSRHLARHGCAHRMPPVCAIRPAPVRFAGDSWRTYTRSFDRYAWNCSGI